MKFFFNVSLFLPLYLSICWESELDPKRKIEVDMKLNNFGSWSSLSWHTNFGEIGWWTSTVRLLQWPANHPVCLLADEPPIVFAASRHTGTHLLRLSTSRAGAGRPEEAWAPLSRQANPSSFSFLPDAATERSLACSNSPSPSLLLQIYLLTLIATPSRPYGAS
jgi:hypothetical protein